MRFLLCILMSVSGLSALADDDYFPMHLGDEWTMAATSSIAGIVNSDVHIKIDAIVEMKGNTYFRLRTWTDGQSPEKALTALKRKDEKADYFIDDREKDSVEQKVILLPLAVGATWQQNLGNFQMTHTVIGMESVEIASKTYRNCYHIRQSVPDHFIMDFWLAPNLGEVKSESVYPTGLKIGNTLKEFKPGK